MTGAKKLKGDKLTEAEAIERAKQGDAEAFEFLYSLHKRRVYSLCLRMTGNPASAEDLTQEAFLQLFRKIGTFRGESAFSTWLHRMSVNVVLMQLRKKSLPSGWPVRSTGCTCKERLTSYRPVIVGSLYCTTSKVTSTTRLLAWWAAPSEIASRSCTKRG